jgi:hypothetical protein
VIRRRASQLLIVLLVALAVPLAGCRAQTGAALFVGDERIPTTEVEDAVQDVLDDPGLGEEARGATAQVRQQVVTGIIVARLMRHVVEAENIRVDTSQIDPLEKEFGKRDRRAWSTLQVPLIHVLPKRDAAELAVNWITVQRALTDRAGGQQADPQQVAAQQVMLLTEQLKKYQVTVNPRYGRFDPEQFRLLAPKNPAVKDRKLPQQQPATP